MTEVTLNEEALNIFNNSEQDEERPYNATFYMSYDEADKIRKALSSTSNEGDVCFEKCVRPLMKYLADKHHPHTWVIVSSTTSEIVEGVASFNTEDYLTD